MFCFLGGNMFENTKVEDKYASKLKNIYKKHYEKCNISTKSLSKILDFCNHAIIYPSRISRGTF